MIKMYCSKNSKVLAVGDGFNDFTMLKEADLSIGIRSREILQVRNTCDVIVSRFSQIVNLIIVHGTWNFWRLMNIALLSFYANFIITFPMFIHQNSNPVGSCFFLFSPGILTLNIVTINLFIIFIFCFDQPVERTLLTINNNVYKENFYDTKKIIFEFGLEIIRGLADSLIIYFYFYKVECINKEGETLDQEIFGIAIFCTLFSTVILKSSSVSPTKPAIISLPKNGLSNLETISSIWSK
jgi:magnesium-transporting ATPase (P-type)